MLDGGRGGRSRRRRAGPPRARRIVDFLPPLAAPPCCATTRSANLPIYVRRLDVYYHSRLVGTTYPPGRTNRASPGRPTAYRRPHRPGHVGGDDACWRGFGPMSDRDRAELFTREFDQPESPIVARIWADSWATSIPPSSLPRATRPAASCSSSPRPPRRRQRRCARRHRLRSRRSRSVGRRHHRSDLTWASTSPDRRSTLCRARRGAGLSTRDRSRELRLASTRRR